MIPWSRSVTASLRTRFPELKKSRVRSKEKAVEILGSHNNPEVTITFEDPDWTVWTKEGHIHMDTSAEAIEVVTLLLMGNACFVEEFRGETLAATWYQIRKGNEYEKQDGIAYFLCPFEEEEWALGPGEYWNQILTLRNLSRVTGEIQVSTQELQTTTPTLPNTLQWLNNGLGDPPLGTRWAVFQNRFVFPVPKGWKRIAQPGKEQFVNFRGSEEEIVFRARSYYRDSETPLPNQIEHAVGPSSIESTMGDTDKDWTQHTWTMHFSNGKTDMLGILDYFYRPSKEAQARILLQVLEAAISLSLFTPLEWDMTRG